MNKENKAYEKALIEFAFQLAERLGSDDADLMSAMAKQQIVLVGPPHSKLRAAWYTLIAAADAKFGKDEANGDNTNSAIRII